MQSNKGRETLILLNKGPIDLGVKFQWRFFGADLGGVERGERERVASTNC